MGGVGHVSRRRRRGQPTAKGKERANGVRRGRGDGLYLYRGSRRGLVVGRDVTDRRVGTLGRRLEGLQGPPKAGRCSDSSTGPLGRRIARGAKDGGGTGETSWRRFLSRAAGSPAAATTHVRDTGEKGALRRRWRLVRREARQRVWLASSLARRCRFRPLDLAGFARPGMEGIWLERMQDGGWEPWRPMVSEAGGGLALAMRPQQVDG